MKKAESVYNSCFGGLVVYIEQQKYKEYLKELDSCNANKETHEARCQTCYDSDKHNDPACVVEEE